MAHQKTFMEAEHIVETSRVGNGIVEIPQLRNVGEEIDVLGTYEMPKQFGEHETENKRGMLTSKPVDVEIGHSCIVNLDASAVFLDSNGEQRDEVSCTERDGQTALGTFVDSSPSPANFCFHTDKIVSIEWRDVVPRQRTGDCSGIHFLRSVPCDLLLSNHQHFLHEVRLRQCVFCKEPS